VNGLKTEKSPDFRSAVDRVRHSGYFLATFIFIPDSAVKHSGQCAGRESVVAKTPNCAVSKSCLLLHPILVIFMMVIKAPLLEVHLEAEHHWLRYGRLVSRALRQWQLRNARLFKLSQGVML
jgi:hypothetical protein